jgi:hypothetical protein
MEHRHSALRTFRFSDLPGSDSDWGDVSESDWLFPDESLDPQSSGPFVSE